MKRLALPLLIVAGLTTSALAADMATKAPPAPPAPPPSPWDVAITAAVMNDYNFRGITQSRHNPSGQAGFELRYTVSPSGNTTPAFPVRASISRTTPQRKSISTAAFGRPSTSSRSISAFGTTGIRAASASTATLPRPAIRPAPIPSLHPSERFYPNGNVVKGNLSFVEIYGKATYTINDQWAVGIQEWYSPSVLNSGADGWFTTGNITYTVPTTMLPSGIGMLISGDAGYWALGTSDNFYCTRFPGCRVRIPACAGAYPGGVPYKSYWTWDAGVSFTYKAFTLDLRYYDTNLTKAECNVFTSDHTSTFDGGSVTNLNPGGLASNWCSAAFVAKLSFATNLSNIK